MSRVVSNSCEVTQDAVVFVVSCPDFGVACSVPSHQGYPGAV
jgi:hypothetical protein